MKWILIFFTFIIFSLPHPTTAQSYISELTITHTERVTYANWDNTYTRILTTSDDGAIRMSDAQSGNIIWERENDSSMSGAVWNKDKSLIATWTTDNQILLIDTEIGAVTDRLTTGNPIKNGLWKSDGTAFIFYDDHILNIQTVNDQIFSDGIFALESPEAILSVQWNMDESQILVLDETNVATLWGLSTQEKIATYTFPDDTTGVAQNTDATKFVSWGTDSGVILWQVADNELRRIDTFRHTRTFIIGAKWVMNDSQLLTWGADETARLWDVATSDQLLQVRHTDWVTGANLNTDGTKLVTWAYQFAYVWNVATGDLIRQALHDNLVSGAILNGDETRLLTWGWDGKARVWNLDG